MGSIDGDDPRRNGLGLSTRRYHDGMTDLEFEPVLESTDEPAMPDVPAAMIVALAQAVIGLVVAFGVGVTPELQSAIVQLITVLAVVIPTADAWIRGKRNDRLATERAARARADANAAAAERLLAAGHYTEPKD
jgi:hypothetical protein